LAIKLCNSVAAIPKRVDHLIRFAGCPLSRLSPQEKNLILLFASEQGNGLNRQNGFIWTMLPDQFEKLKLPSLFSWRGVYILAANCAFILNLPGAELAEG